MNPDAQDHADALEPGQEAPPPACVMTFNVSDASGAGGVAGDVATIALIDKGSFLVAVLMAWWLLGETPTARILVGSLLILSGLLVVSWKPAG